MPGVAVHRVEQPAAAGALVQGDRGLHHVAGAVEFVPVPHVGPLELGMLQREMGLQVSVRLHRRDHEVGGLEYGLLKIRVGKRRQAVCRGFDPLGEVAVLEHHALELARLDAGAVVIRRRAHVGDAVGRLGAGNPVVQGLPLVRDHPVAYPAGVVPPESFADAYVPAAGNLSVIALFHIHTSLAVVVFRTGTVLFYPNKPILVGSFSPVSAMQKTADAVTCSLSS